MKRQLCKCKGSFTLIELLVVITIIAILTSILLPSLKRARGTAMKVTCLNNLRQLHVGLVMYANDNADKIPPCRHTGLDPYWSRVAAAATGIGGTAYQPSGRTWKYTKRLSVQRTHLTPGTRAVTNAWVPQPVDPD